MRKIFTYLSFSRICNLIILFFNLCSQRSRCHQDPRWSPKTRTTIVKVRIRVNYDLTSIIVRDLIAIPNFLLKNKFVEFFLIRMCCKIYKKKLFFQIIMNNFNLYFFPRLNEKGNEINLHVNNRFWIK